MTDESNQKEYSPFEHLQFRVAEAHWRWKVWKQLYLGDPKQPDELFERHAIMNSVAPAFFRMLQTLLLEDVQLRICKLTDPEEGGPPQKRRRNLSLRAAIAGAAIHIADARRSEALELVKKMESVVKPLKVWRDRQGAHQDWLTTTGTEKLPPRRLDEIDDALDLAVKIMQLLDSQWPDREYAYDKMIAHGDGAALLHALRTR